MATTGISSHVYGGISGLRILIVPRQLFHTEHGAILGPPTLAAKLGPAIEENGMLAIEFGAVWNLSTAKVYATTQPYCCFAVNSKWLECGYGSEQPFYRQVPDLSVAEMVGECYRTMVVSEKSELAIVHMRIYDVHMPPGCFAGYDAYGLQGMGDWWLCRHYDFLGLLHDERMSDEARAKRRRVGYNRRPKEVGSDKTMYPTSTTDYNW